MSGTIMGCAIEEVLRKSTNQIIYSQKIIQGFINASEFIINGLINDVNLTKLVYHQLKKNNPLQIIRTGIELHNSLNIIGNLTIKGVYEKSEMKIFDKNYSNAQTIIKRMKRFIRTAEIINIALRSIFSFYSFFFFLLKKIFDLGYFNIWLSIYRSSNLHK